MTLPAYGQPIVRSDPQTFPDNIKLFFGDDNDASIYYDGSDLIINPKEVGSGIVKLEGDISIGGGDVAGAGTIRLPNASNIVFRNAANSGDVEAVQVDGSDNVIIGNVGNGNTLYRTESGFVHQFDQTIQITVGSLDLNSQSSILNVGAAGNDWTSTLFQIQNDPSVENILETIGSGTAANFLAKIPAGGTGAARFIWREGSGNGTAGNMQYFVEYRSSNAYLSLFSVDTDGAATAADIWRILDGQLSIDANTTWDDNAFDEYDDTALLAASISPVAEAYDFGNGVLKRGRDVLIEVGVLRKYDDGFIGYNDQRMAALLAGAIYQIGHRMHNQIGEIDRRLVAIGA